MELQMRKFCNELYPDARRGGIQISHDASKSERGLGLQRPILLNLFNIRPKIATFGAVFRLLLIYRLAYGLWMEGLVGLHG